MGTTKSDGQNMQRVLTDRDWNRKELTSAVPQQATLTGYREHEFQIDIEASEGGSGFRVSGEMPKSAIPILRALSELLKLRSNWDSYGAKPIDTNIAAAAIELLFLILDDDLPSPSVIPTSTGRIQFEWHTSNVDLEIEVLSSSKVHVYFHDLKVGDEQEGTMSSDWFALSRFINRLRHK